jgi:hypothetical protein
VLFFGIFLRFAAVPGLDERPALRPRGTKTSQYQTFLGCNRYVDGAWEPQEGWDNPPGISAAGRAHMSLRAWAKIVTEMLRADAGQSTLLSQEQAQRLTTGQVLADASNKSTYALGWNVVAGGRSWGGTRVVFHTGTNTANHCIAWLGLEKGLGFLIAVNARDQGQISSSAMDELSTLLVREGRTMAG